MRVITFALSWAWLPLLAITVLCVWVALSPPNPSPPAGHAATFLLLAAMLAALAFGASHLGKRIRR